MEDLFIKKQFATIKETQIDPPNKNELRVYCTFYDRKRKDNCDFLFQIRTHKPIDKWQNGKDRNMIAGVHLTIKEMEDILKYMKKAQKEKY
jgi:hypothetical protein